MEQSLSGCEEETTRVACHATTPEWAWEAGRGLMKMSGTTLCDIKSRRRAGVAEGTVLPEAAHVPRRGIWGIIC